LGLSHVIGVHANRIAGLRKDTITARDKKGVGSRAGRQRDALAGSEKYSYPLFTARLPPDAVLNPYLFDPGMNVAVRNQDHEHDGAASRAP